MTISAMFYYLLRRLRHPWPERKRWAVIGSNEEGRRVRLAQFHSIGAADDFRVRILQHALPHHLPISIETR